MSDRRLRLDWEKRYHPRAHSFNVADVNSGLIDCAIRMPFYGSMLSSASVFCWTLPKNLISGGGKNLRGGFQELRKTHTHSASSVVVIDFVRTHHAILRFAIILDIFNQFELLLSGNKVPWPMPNFQRIYFFRTAFQKLTPVVLTNGVDLRKSFIRRTGILAPLPITNDIPT